MDMESKTILDVTATNSNTCTTSVKHTGDDTGYRCSWNLLAFLLKCNTYIGPVQRKFLSVKLQLFSYPSV